MSRYTRFVAMGDSQTEGLWDGDDAIGIVGWADRFAQRLAADNPDLLYANLAVRGRRVADTRDEQLDTALAMRPDIVGICVGMNDITRPRADIDEVLDILEEIYARLASKGITVITTTFPDVRQIIPVARLLGPRVDRINDLIRRCTEKYDLRLVDLFSAPSMSDPQMWSADRLHGSPLGHERFALAAAEAVGLAGSDHTWADALPVRRSDWLPERIRDEISWAVAYLGPSVVRRLRGESTGTGRGPKRPELRPLSAGDTTSSESVFVLDHEV